jgi:hypothetical protein
MQPICPKPDADERTASGLAVVGGLHPAPPVGIDRAIDPLQDSRLLHGPHSSSPDFERCLCGEDARLGESVHGIGILHFVAGAGDGRSPRRTPASKVVDDARASWSGKAHSGTGSPFTANAEATPQCRREEQDGGEASTVPRRRGWRHRVGQGFSGVGETGPTDCPPGGD